MLHSSAFTPPVGGVLQGLRMLDVRICRAGMDKDGFYDAFDPTYGGRVRFWAPIDRLSSVSSCIDGRGWHPPPLVTSSRYSHADIIGLATNVIRSVRYSLHFGASNNTPPIAGASGVSARTLETQSKMDFRLDVGRSGTHAFLQSIGATASDRSIWPIVDGSLAAHACYTKTGNCGEHAACTFAYLVKYGVGLRIALVWSNCHCYNVVFHGGSSYIVDPWVLEPRVCNAESNAFDYSRGTLVKFADIHSAGLDICLDFYGYAQAYKVSRGRTRDRAMVAARPTVHHCVSNVNPIYASSFPAVDFPPRFDIGRGVNRFDVVRPDGTCQPPLLPRSDRNRSGPMDVCGSDAMDVSPY